MKTIIYDVEVFSFDFLLGALVIDEKNQISKFQTWSLEETKNFYKNHSKDIWVGWNISRYDNLILESVIQGKNPKTTNDEIIKQNFRKKIEIPLYYFDLMKNHQTGLKVTEAYVGKNISETEVDFDIKRPLTKEEKEKTEKYNLDDLYQTYDNFLYLKDEFILRIELIKEFGLSLLDLDLTGTQIAEKVLKAKKDYSIEEKRIYPNLYENLILGKEERDEVLKDYFLKDRFRSTEKISIDLCGLKHQIGSGGIHAAKKNYRSDWALYLDVSGYYNLIMLNYDLLPRSLSEESKKLYEYMYHQQLKLKGKPELAMKRNVYKVLLLAVFGAMMNKYSKFYDPWKGLLVTITGQLFIVDLLEKLEGKIILIQSNTDGIMVKPYGVDEEEVLAIVKEWCQRTGFVIKPKKIYNIVQRDVNNYIYESEEGYIEAKGEAVKHFECFINPFGSDGYGSKEPLIINKCIVDYFVKNKPPEETVEESKTDLRLFQYICKKNSFDYLQIEIYKKEIDSQGKEIETKILEKRIQNVNRAFASVDLVKKGKIIKYKKDGKKAKISNLPESVFIYNQDITDKKVFDELKDRIDWEYYILRSYERILEFLGIKE